MKTKFKIVSFFLSFMVFLSPLMAYGNAIYAEDIEILEDCCVVDEATSSDVHACCINDVEEPSKSCEDSPCHPTTCHISQVNVLPAHIQENLEQIKYNLEFSKKIKFDNYKSLRISDVSSSTWKPPRVNS